MNKFYNYIVAVGIALSLFSCNAPEREPYHTVQDKLEKLEVEGDVDFGVSSTDHLETLLTVETDSAFTDGKFLVPDRISQLKHYKCSECHSKPLDELKVASVGKKKSHWDVELHHANASTMSCVTCHDGSDMNNLYSLNKDSISFNESYKVCAQCHSTQFKDWKIGAHGKRLGGWAPPRVSNTCVNCHNPHSPSFESRWPSRYNTKMAKEHKHVEQEGEGGH